MACKTIRYSNTDVFIYEQDNETIELLQSDKKYPLSQFYSNEGKVKTIINCSYFTNDYVLGRNQGDLYNNTHDQEGFYDLVFTSDNKYHIGQYKSWDYQNDVLAGFSVASILIENGIDVSKVSSSIESNSKITNRNPQTAIGILKNGKVLFIVADGRTSKSNGLTGIELRDLIKSNYDIELLCQLDGGGSSEMIVDNEIINNPSDNKERAMFNGLALIEKEEIKEDESPMFAERLTKDGLDGNKFWYSNEFNPYAMDDLWLPNCTNYAWGRSSEIANRNLRKDLMDTYPNAQDWYKNAKWEKGSTAKIGAIGVWGGNQYGHVAIVEEINDDKVLFSQSNYSRPIDKNSSNYFETKEYTPIVNKITNGVGLTFLGYIYNPYINDKRVSRNTNNDQIEVLVDLIRIRKTPNGEILKGLYCSKGLYNILETKDDGDYIWVKLDTDLWIASNDEYGWTKTYLKENSDDVEALKKEVERLQKENEELEQQYHAILAEFSIWQEKIREIQDECHKETDLIIGAVEEIDKAIERLIE